jgi:hypothetical protein
MRMIPPGRTERVFNRHAIGVHAGVNANEDHGNRAEVKRSHFIAARMTRGDFRPGHKTQPQGV